MKCDNFRDLFQGWGQLWNSEISIPTGILSSGLHGLQSFRRHCETGHVNPLFCHTHDTLALHGVYNNQPMKPPVKSHCFATHLIGITWGLHWSIHETAHINHCLATHWYYMGLLLLAHETVHEKPLFFQTLALHGVYIGWLRKLPI